MAKVFTAAVKDPHSVSLYDASTGNYEGVIYVTSGSIVGNPIVTPKTLSIQILENGRSLMVIFELPSKNLKSKIYL